MSIVRRPKDLLSGLLFLLGGAFALTVSDDYPLGTLRNMGPGYFPAILSSLLCLVGLALMAVAFAGRRDAAPSFSLAPLAIVMGGVLIFALSLLGAGLFLATTALVMIVTLAARPYRPLASILLALSLAAASVAIFVFGLGQQLPIVGHWIAF